MDEEIEHHRLLTLQWRFERNAETRICQLPTEILCHIFLLTRRAYEVTADAKPTPSPHKRLPYQFLWIFDTTHVCRHWRAVALNEPALWTRPTLFLPNLGKLMINRARMAGLSMQVEQTQVGQDLMDIILQHMSHTKEFDILNGTPRGLQKLFSQLPSAAPMLETLIIRYEADRYDFTAEARAGVTIPTSLFSEVTSLRALTLARLSIQDWDSPLFDHLTSFSLNDIPHHRWPNLAQLKAMLSRMPQLTDLVLGDTCPSSGGSQELVYLPNLKSLVVGNSASQIKAVYGVVAVPPKLEFIKTCFAYRPDIDFIDIFSTAKRVHLPDMSSPDGLHLEISSQTEGPVFRVMKNRDILDDEDPEDDEDDEGSALIPIKCSWIHYSPTREVTAHRHIFTGMMTSLDWTNLRTLHITFTSLTPEILRSSVGSLPRLNHVILCGRVAVPFINGLHLGWDIDPTIEPGSLAFAQLLTITFYKVEFSFDEEDADEGALALDLLQECLMGRCERGAAIYLVMIELCEGICGADVDELSDLVPRISWDGEEIGFDSDDESSE